MRPSQPVQGLTALITQVDIIGTNFNVYTYIEDLESEITGNLRVQLQYSGEPLKSILLAIDYNPIEVIPIQNNYLNPIQSNTSYQIFLVADTVSYGSNTILDTWYQETGDIE